VTKAVNLEVLYLASKEQQQRRQQQQSLELVCLKLEKELK